MAYYGGDYISPEHDDEEYQDDLPQKGKRKSAAGRKLVRWNPDLDQLVLLCVDHVAVKNNIPIPWDEVAKLINDFMSGEAIKQHLAKIYKYREQDGHPVPPKLDRSQRRIANRPSNGSTNSGAANTVRGRGTKKTGPNDAAEAVPEPVKPGSSLLFKTPQKNKTPKRSANTPKTPAAPGRGRKNVKHIKIEDDDSDDEYSARKTKMTSRGGKRGRATRREEDELEIEISPSKKPKTNSYLRATTAVNYSEQMAPEEDEVDGTYQEDSSPSGGASQQHASSQGSIHGSIYSQPPPHFAYPTAQSTPQHGYPGAQTPVTNCGTTSPYHAASANAYGLPIQHPQPLTNQDQGIAMQNGLFHGNSTSGMLHGGFNGMDANTHTGLGFHGIAGLDDVHDPYTSNNTLHSQHGAEHVIRTIETQEQEHHASPNNDHQPGFNMFSNNDSQDFIPSPQSLENHNSPNGIAPHFNQNGFHDGFQNQQEPSDGVFRPLPPTQQADSFVNGYGDIKHDMTGGGGGGGQVLGEVTDTGDLDQFSVDDLFNNGSNYLGLDDNALLGF